MLHLEKNQEICLSIPASQSRLHFLTFIIQHPVQQSKLWRILLLQKEIINLKDIWNSLLTHFLVLKSFLLYSRKHQTIYIFCRNLPVHLLTKLFRYMGRAYSFLQLQDGRTKPHYFKKANGLTLFSLTLTLQDGHKLRLG